MPTEKQIREAIKTSVIASAPAAVVISRDAVDWTNKKWLNWLNSPSDGGKLHGYLITWDGGESEPPYLQDYEAIISILGAYAWRFGNDSSNSSDEFSAEVEALITRLITPATRPTELSGLKSWGARVYVSDEPGYNIHVAKIQLITSATMGC